MAAPVGQNNWRFCTKCFGLWWNGYESKGVCPAGGTHTAARVESGAHGTPANIVGGAAPSWDFCLVGDPVGIGGTE